MRIATVVLVCVGLAACKSESSELPDAALPDANVSQDASVAADAASAVMDASVVVDAAPMADAATPVDTGLGVDAALVLDATRDSAATADASAAMSLTSTAFIDEGSIPVSPYACSPAGNYGTGTSPPLAWSDAPSGTLSFVLLMDDPSAGNWTHWVLYDIAPTVSSIAAGGSASGARVGVDEASFMQYSGPCPPDDVHRYSIRLYALDIATLSLSTGATKASVVSAMTGHVLATAELNGTVAFADL